MSAWAFYLGYLGTWAVLLWLEHRYRKQMVTTYSEAMA